MSADGRLIVLNGARGADTWRDRRDRRRGEIDGRLPDYDHLLSPPIGEVVGDLELAALAVVTRVDFADVDVEAIDTNQSVVRQLRAAMSRAVHVDEISAAITAVLTFVPALVEADVVPAALRLSAAEVVELHKLNVLLRSQQTVRMLVSFRDEVKEISLLAHAYQRLAFCRALEADTSALQELDYDVVMRLGADLDGWHDRPRMTGP